MGMVDGLMGRVFAPLFVRLARHVRLDAAMAAALGFVVALAGLPAIGLQLWWLGVAMLLASRLVFAIAVARVQGSGEPSSSVALVAVLKAVSLAGYPFAFALALPEHAAAIAFLMFALMAVFAAGFAFPPPNGMGDFAVGGLDVALLLGLCALLPEWFGPIAYGGGLICFVAAGLRIDAARRGS